VFPESLIQYLPHLAVSFKGYKEHTKIRCGNIPCNKVVRKDIVAKDKVMSVEYSSHPKEFSTIASSTLSPLFSVRF